MSNGLRIHPGTVDDDGYYLRAIATYIDATSEMDDPDTGAIDERVQESATAAYTPTTDDGTDAHKVFRVMARRPSTR